MAANLDNLNTAMASAVDTGTPLSPDTTSISPTTSLERTNSLEKHLQTRPAPQDLKDRNILLDTSAAPSLQSIQKELERQRASDSLRKGLENRSERSELVDREWFAPCKIECAASHLFWVWCCFSS